MKFTIPGRLPALNEIINQSKTHWTKYRTLKKEGIELVQFALMQHKVKPMPDKRVILSIFCYEPNAKRDPDNVFSGAGKIILDALVNSGIITNDSQKYIGGIVYGIATDKINPRIEVEIKKLED
jgi:Holliday junction resolvase RusA-like endonuclease